MAERRHLTLCLTPDREADILGFIQWNEFGEEEVSIVQSVPQVVSCGWILLGSCDRLQSVASVQGGHREVNPEDCVKTDVSARNMGLVIPEVFIRIKHSSSQKHVEKCLDGGWTPFPVVLVARFVLFDFLKLVRPATRISLFFRKLLTYSLIITVSFTGFTFVWLETFLTPMVETSAVFVHGVGLFAEPDNLSATLR
ncbi:Neurexophilin [Branchiostoma belcheri]|nr:Neurexophilin [Branchiostoma belcheri]